MRDLAAERHAVTAAEQSDAAVSAHRGIASPGCGHQNVLFRPTFAIVALAVSALAVGGWARASALRPEARGRSALRALDSGNIERLQYELLYLTSSPELQPYASLLRGKLLLAAKEPAAAIDRLEVAAAGDETRTRALVLTGEAFYRLNRLVEAGETWARVLEIAPQDVDANRWLAAAYFDLGATREAFHYLREVARLVPDDGRPHRAMGLMHLRANDYAEAIEDYQESLRRDPNQPDANLMRVELAEALHRVGRDPDALSALEPCPVSADVLALRASCVYAQRKVDAVWDILNESLALDPNHVKSLTLRGKLLLERKQYQEAADCLERAARIDPLDPDVLEYLVAAQQRLGNVARADALKPIRQELSWLRYRYYHLMVTKAAKDPRDAAVRAELGSIAARLGQTEKAKSWYRASLFLDPDNQAAAAALQSLSGGAGVSDLMR